MDADTGIRCRVPAGPPRCNVAVDRAAAAKFKRSCLDDAEDYGRSQRACLVPPARAERVMEYGLRGMETEDVHGRVSALERGVNPGPVHELDGFNDAESDFETDKAA